MARKKGAHPGGHGWFVTFADLMGLLMSFFVMMLAFSKQDEQKLNIVAGSMRDAFGVQKELRYSGIIEVAGLPTRHKLKNAAHIPPEESSTRPDESDSSPDTGTRLKADRAFAVAAASLRNALQSMPEITEAMKNVMFEETPEGLNIEIVDQDGRSMFPEGSKEPYDRTRTLLAKIAAPLKATPYRIAITGHTAASRIPTRLSYGPWELSSDRANAVRQVLETEGVPVDHFFVVAGKSDTQPLFADDSYIAANRRVTITLMREQPPIPVDFKP
jgi:chemotaxis protein MotB